MKLLRDPLGRPIQRIYFSTEDLDERCERKIAEFMRSNCRGYRLPVPTDDLIRLIEAETEDLDLYADLPDDEDGILTSFPIACPSSESQSASPIPDMRTAFG